MPNLRRLLSACFAVTFLVATAALAQTETPLYSFSNTTDGYDPQAPLILASDGNFYGTTSDGGNGSSGATDNRGTVFKITPAGVLTTLYRFCNAGSCADGELPDAALIEASDGNLYGTTFEGGAHQGGVVFKVNASTGAYSVVYSFCKLTACGDGENPEAAIVQGVDGNFYGTTVIGGTNNLGTAFKLTPSGTLTTLYNFCSATNCADGDFPVSGLVQGSDGNFYGATGLFSSKGSGSIYQLTPSGVMTVLYTFCNSPGCTDGQFSTSTLIQAGDGNFYGTTQQGGINGAGAAFSISPTGDFNVIHSFCSSSGCPDGNAPESGLLQATDGYLYGTTARGGTGSDQADSGTLFQLSTSGNFASIYNFCSASGCTDGETANGAPIQGVDGDLYSTTSQGGSNDDGTVFKLAVGKTLAAPVQLSLSPSSIKLGASTTLSWKVPYAYSDTAHLCNAFVQNAATGAGKWTGTQAGTYSTATNSYTGSASVTPTAAGTYTYALTCGGTVSGFATLTVTSNKSNSTTTLTANPTAPTIGQSVTLTAKISAASGTPTGTVTFSYGSDVLHTSTLSGGVATFTASTNGLPAATYTITAKYSGDTNYNTSSGTDTVKLSPAATTTTFTATPTSVTPPASVTLTATVKRSTGSGTPTGSVTFYANKSDALATVKLNASGVATITASSKGYPAGTYPLTAKYLGDSSDTTSTSSAVDVTVK